MVAVFWVELKATAIEGLVLTANREGGGSVGDGDGDGEGSVR